MTDSLVEITLLTVIVVAILAVQIVNFLMRRRWRAHEQYAFLVTGLGFQRRRDRFLVDTRILRYGGTRHGRHVAVEVGAGAQGVYLRVDFEFDRPVDLGLRISSEQEDGLMTRVMRLREIEVGHEGFDSQFILLSRDETRLRALLDHDIRHMLLGIGERVHDLRLNDDGLHLQVIGALPDGELEQLIDTGVHLANTVYARAEQLQEQRRRDEEQLSVVEAFAPVTGSLPAIKVEESR